MEEDHKKQIEKQLKESKKKLKKEIELADLKFKKAKAEEAELKLNQTRQKFEESKANVKGKFGSNSEPRKSLSTYLRNQNKFEVSALAVLDRKASILIKICPTIISGLLVFHDYIETNVVSGNLISLILLIGLMISLILSILSIKPSTRGFDKIVSKQIKPSYPRKEENSFFTWEYDSFEDYDKALEELTKSQDLQLGNMMRAHYILGRSNVTIANYLDMAYNVFLLSFVLSGITFIISKYFIL